MWKSFSVTGTTDAVGPGFLPEPPQPATARPSSPAVDTTASIRSPMLTRARI